jgi:hypothetical protein
MGNDDPREEVPVMAEAYWRVELEAVGAPSVTVYQPTGAVCREVVTVTAGSTAVVDVPFRVRLRPAEPAGPRRRA